MLQILDIIMWPLVIILLSFVLHLRFPPANFLWLAVVQVSAVFLAFRLHSWFSKRTKDRESKRAERFVLGLIWHELRINKNTLKQIENNFAFSITAREMKYAAKRMEILSQLANKIQDKNFNSTQSSGGIYHIKSDGVFNSITIAFENCNYLQVNLIIAAHDFRLKYEIINDTEIDESIREDMKENLVPLAKEKIDIAKRELNAAQTTVDNALSEVDDRLESLDVPSELVERPLGES